MNPTCPPTALYGFRCSIDDPKLLRGLRIVFKQIRQRYPADYRRIRRRLLAIRWMARKKSNAGIDGQVIREKQGLERYSDPRCLILIARALSDEPEFKIRAVVAHELGHVATRLIDEERRQAFSDEWSRELAADWYVYRWGFGKDMARLRKHRDPEHPFLNATPGQVISISGRRYLLTRNLIVHSLRSRHKRPESR